MNDTKKADLDYVPAWTMCAWGLIREGEEVMRADLCMFDDEQLYLTMEKEQWPIPMPESVATINISLPPYAHIERLVETFKEEQDCSDESDAYLQLLTVGLLIHQQTPVILASAYSDWPYEDAPPPFAALIFNDDNTTSITADNHIASARAIGFDSEGRPVGKTH